MRLKQIENCFFRLSKIEEGNYRLSAFFDKDSNSIYTNGSLFPYRPAEWFNFYEDTIKIRGNWDLELDNIKIEWLNEMCNPCGGTGTVFGHSRKNNPKQLLNIIGQKSMLQITIDRLKSKFNNRNIYYNSH